MSSSATRQTSVAVSEISALAVARRITGGRCYSRPMKAARSPLAVAMSWFSVALLAGGAEAQAADLFTVTTTEPLFAFAGSGVQVFAWSQETVYFNVDITATLADTTAGAPIAGAEGVVYLTTRFGPGTTP